MNHLNQLSQLLYWGNVFGNLGGLLVAFGFLLFFATIISLVAFGTMADDSYGKKFLWIPISSAVVFFILCLASWTGAAFCPNQETVYAIAASQMGEQALKTPLADKASKALESWLDKQITDNSSK